MFKGNVSLEVLKRFYFLFLFSNWNVCCMFLFFVLFIICICLYKLIFIVVKLMGINVLVERKGNFIDFNMF